jgi:hypothetical protein
VAAPEPAPSPTTAPATSGPPALDESNRKKESELAAAWANWKQVREAIVDSQLAAKVADVAAAELKDTQRAESSTARPEDETEAPAPPPAADPSAIASIVDSVLAELKPKLVEEIARKMGSEGEKKRKKKKD